MQTLRSLIFSIGMIIVTIIYAPPSVLSIVLPYRWRYAFINSWRLFMLWWVKVSCGIKYEVDGLENIPKDQTCIIFSRHESTWETLALGKWFPPHVWILKRELLFVPFFGWGLSVLEPIAIDRKAGRKAINQIIKQGVERLKKGRWVMVFPEGTRLAPDTEKKFGVGGAILASKSGYPIIPVVHNAGEFWRKGQFVKTPGTIHVKIGKPILTEGKSASEINELARDWMSKARSALRQ